jgi:hypothetical protein
MDIKALFLSSFFIVASVGYVGSLEDPTDEGCITSISEIQNRSFADNGTVCKSLEKAHNTIDAFDYRSKTDAPVYEENEFINESEASSKNATQDEFFEHKSKVRDIKMAVFKALIFIFLPIMMAMAYTVKKTLFNNRQNMNQMLDEFILGGVGFTSLLLLLLFVIETDFISNNFGGKFVPKVGNFVAQTLVQPKIVENKKIENVLKQGSYYEAFDIIDKLVDLNICSNNTQKAQIIEESNKFFGGISNEAELIELYKKKNEPYFPLIEDPKGRKIGYYYSTNSNFARVDEIKMSGCGSINFNGNEYNQQIANIMKVLNFSKILSDALKANDYVSGWETIKESYYKGGAKNAFGVPIYSESDDSALKSLLIAYTNEFKKGLVIGSVYFDPLTQKPVASDFSNLTSLISNLDKQYLLTTRAVCVEDKLVLSETNKKIKKAGDKMIDFYYCMDFSTGTMEVVDEIAYLDKKDKQIADDRVLRLSEESKELIEAQVKELAAKYEEVNTQFQIEVEKIYDFDKKTIRLWNEGFYSYSKLLNHLRSFGAEYKYIFAEVMSPIVINADNSYPHYLNETIREQTNSENETYIDFYTVEKVERMKPKYETKKQIVNNMASINISSELLKDHYSSQASEMEVQDPDTMSSYFSAMYNSVTEGISKTLILSCSSSPYGYGSDENFDKEQCIKESIDGAGDIRYLEAKEQLRKSAIGFFEIGMKTWVASQGMSFVANLDFLKVEKPKTAVGKTKKTKMEKLKSGTTTTLRVVSSAVNMVAGLTLAIALCLVILDVFLGIVDIILPMISVYQQTSVGLYIRSMEIMFIGLLTMSIQLIYKAKDFKDLYVKIFDVVMAMPKMTVVFLFVITICESLLSYIKDYLPILYDIDLGSADGGIIEGILVLALVAFTLAIMFYTLVNSVTALFQEYDVKSTVKTVTDDALKNVADGLHMKAAAATGQMLKTYRISRNKSLSRLYNMANSRSSRKREKSANLQGKRTENKFEKFRRVHGLDKKDSDK